MGDVADDAERRALREREEPTEEEIERLATLADGIATRGVVGPPGPLNEGQLAQLNAPLDTRRVKKREGRGGGQFSYLEGHDVKRRANEIFGFGRWGYDVVELAPLDHVEVSSRNASPSRTSGTATASSTATTSSRGPARPA
jgi:hypothetical protein